MALLVDPALTEGVYVEGYAVWPIGLRLPIHHGWVGLADGTVVDPTGAAWIGAPALAAQKACSPSIDTEGYLVPAWSYTRLPA
jgi:hypothetical protein